LGDSFYCLGSVNESVNVGTLKAPLFTAVVLKGRMCPFVELAVPNPRQCIADLPEGLEAPINRELGLDEFFPLGGGEAEGECRVQETDSPPRRSA
jgi:hypothetical protein